MRFDGLMLKSKILSVGFIRVILVVILAVAAVAGFRSLIREFDLTERADKMARQAAQVEVSAADLTSSLYPYLWTGEGRYRDVCLQQEKSLGKDVARLKKMADAAPDQTRLVAGLEEAFNSWKTHIVTPVMQGKQSVGTDGQKQAAAGLARGDEASRSFDRFKEVLRSFQASQDAILRESRANADKIVWYAQFFLVVGTIVISVVSVSISSLVIDAITEPVGKAAALAEAISGGDLSGRIDLQGRDEIARLGMALDQMTQDLRTQTLQTLEAVSVLTGASAEITSTAAQLSEGAFRTSSALMETTTTVEEVKQAAKVSSQQAKSVAQIARQAVEVSQAGQRATTETILKMSQIKDQMQSIGENVVRLSDHSRAIEKIIGSVQDIAEQSNLLAVNASIEAARAGDQGKGFAVVAVEIKELADQSKAATDQVRSILEDTKKWVSALVMATEQGIKAVDAGVEQSSRAGESIDALSRTVDSSAQSAALIDASAGQQFVGIERVATAVSSMETALSQHLAGTAELESAARRLEELGAALRHLVQRYRI